MLTLGPAFVSVTDGSGAPRSFPRGSGRGVAGAATRLCARVTDGAPELLLPSIHTLTVVDGCGAVLAALRWDGNDHDSLETACAAARMPLDRVPGEVAVSGRSVRLPAPGQPRPERRMGRRSPRDTRVALVLGPQEVTVTGAANGPLHWPRLGAGPAHLPAVARLRVTLFADRPVNDPDLLPGPPPGRQRMLGLTLVAAGGRPLAYLQWMGENLDLLRRACAAAGVQVEYRWQPRGDAATLSRQGVPVVRTRAPAANHAADEAVEHAAEPVLPGPGHGHGWIYGLATLVLLLLAVAVAVLSVR